MKNKVGFLLPDNSKVFMDYDEVNDYCKNICESEEYNNEFLDFEKNYTYFDAYFYFVMKKLNYIFINPFLKEDNYLMSLGDSFYTVVGASDIEYEKIKDLAVRVKNGGNYPDVVSCSDQVLNIQPVDGSKIGTWLIDPNGYSMISAEIDINHEITANSVLNLLLTSEKGLWKRLDLNKYAITLLIEHFGFLRTVFYYGNSMIVGVEDFLSDEIKNLIDIYTNSGNHFFYDWGKKYNCDLDKYENYNITKIKEKGDGYGR